MPVHGNGWRFRWQMPKSLKSILLTEDVAKTDQHKTSEVMIGFMSVPLGYFTAQRQDDDLIEAEEHCSTEHAISKPTKIDSVHGGSQSTVKLWRPVNWHEARGPMPVQNGKEDVIIGGKDADLKKKQEERTMAEWCQVKLVYDLVLRVIIGLILTHQWTIIQKESCSRLTMNPVPDPLENS